jgi:hypothetical protein
LIEILVPFPDRVAPVTHVRSTLLTASLQALRQQGHFDRYLQGLPARYHDALLLNVAGQWLPVDVGVAHYRACEALALDAAQLDAIGSEVGRRAQGTFLGTLVRATGMTPWPALLQAPRLMARLFQGGGVEVAKLGPKEARVVCSGNPLATIPYFRVAFLSGARVGVELVSLKAYVRETTHGGGVGAPPTHGTDDTISMRISWV